MTHNMTMFFIFAFSVTVISFIFSKPHFLMLLLYLEALMLMSVIIIALTSCMNNSFMPHSALILLTFGACEASLGLSLMVSMSRHYGSDHLNTFAITKC